MESALGPGAGAEEPSGVLGVERADGRLGNPGEPSRPRRLRGAGSDAPPITGEPGKWGGRPSDRDATAVTLRTSLSLIALFARLSAPLLPTTAELLLGALGVGLGRWPEGLDTGDAVPGAPFEIPPVLFAKITDHDVERWR